MQTKKQCRDAHISVTKEILEYNRSMARNLPTWREQQIRAAHKALLDSRPKPPPTRKRLTHPVLIGERG